MPHLTLLLLGPPRIELDGMEAAVDTRKAVALVAYLAVTGQRQSRDTLAGLLWPEYSQANARATLRRTLSALNKALHGEHLLIEREALALAGENLTVDTRLFKGRIEECEHHGHGPAEVCPRCVAPLTEAAQLYRGDFLAGFALRDSPDFDDWQLYQAESFRRELSATLEKLARLYAALADFERAIEYARRWLSLDRLNEPAHRYLMLLYAWSGGRAAALQQYRECIRALQEDLGVAPLEATTQLYNDIRENRVPPPPTPLAEAQEGKEGRLRGRESPAAGTPEQPPAIRTEKLPMVGRNREWSALVQSYEATSTGVGGRVLAVAGEAGIGKTRLCEEFLAYVRGQGALTAVARCYEGESNLAYGPVAEALRSAVRLPGGAERLATLPAPWLGEVARLLPEIAAQHPGLPAPPPLDNPGAQGRFFEGVRQALWVLLGGPTPGVLFFSDVHWADGASVDLLTYMARRLSDLPVCLLLAWRTEDLQQGSRLLALVTEAQRRGEATYVALGRLSFSEVGELVSAVGMGEGLESKALAGRLYRETEGLPFFLVEYLAAVAREAQENGSDEWSLPGGVRDLLVSRLRSVDEAGLQILNTAAVIGRSFDFDTLQQASGRSEEESVKALEELVAAGLVVEIRGGKAQNGPLSVSPWYDFSHEKLRNLVYEETSLARRRLLHRRIAEALAARARSPREGGALAGQVAHHYRLAGSEDLAADYYRQAGEHARRLYANAEALAHLRMALALGHSDVAALHEAIGDLQTLLGEYGEALGSYETAAALSDGEALAGIEHKLGTVYGRRGEWESAESHLEAALSSYGENGPAGKKARVYADRSLVAYHRGDIAEAQELATHAFRLAQDAGDMRAQAQAHNMLGILAASRGDFAEARSNLEESLALAEKLADPAARAAALNNLALAHGAAGEPDRALSLAENALVLSAAQGDRHREAAIHSNLADLLHASGRSEEAMSHLKQAVAIYAEIGVEAGDVQPAIWRLTEW